MLEASPTTRPDTIVDLYRALERLDAVKETFSAAAENDTDVDAIVAQPTAAAHRLGVELNDLVRSAESAARATDCGDLEDHRPVKNRPRRLANLIMVALLALGSMGFVWRLTRRLSDEHAFARGVIDASPVAILWKDRAGRLLGYNDVFAKLHGFSVPGEGLGKHARDLGLREEDVRMFDGAGALRHGERVSRCSTCRSRSVRRAVENWLSISRVPMRDARGRITGVLINFTEESERVHAEQLALEMSGRLAMGLNAAHGGEWEWNVQTGAANLSDRWMNLFGLQRTPEADHFDFFRERVHPDDFPAIEAALDDHFSGASSEYRVEYRVKTGDGTYRWSLGCGRVVERDAQSQPVRMQGLNLDIHPAKQAQEELQEAAERAYGQPGQERVSGHHEPRTADPVERGHRDDRVAPGYGTGRPAAEPGGVEPLLRKPAAGPDQRPAGLLEDRSGPFGTGARAVLTRALRVVGRRGHGPARAPRRARTRRGDRRGGAPMCLGDNGRLRQVLVNLVANAVKFTEAGRVRICLSEVDHPTFRNAAGRALSFAVIDTGIGIPADKQARFSNPSCRPIPRSPAATAAPGWGSRSRARWSRPWAARSRSTAPKAAARRSP